MAPNVLIFVSTVAHLWILLTEVKLIQKHKNKKKDVFVRSQIC
jgi:hypothetical protein